MVYKNSWEESEDYVRAKVKHNRPRTKQRPVYENSEVGRIITVDRGRYSVLLAENTVYEKKVLAVRSRYLHKTTIVVGDFVSVVGDLSGSVDSLARLVGLQKRTSVLKRCVDDSNLLERVIVANVDQLVIVVAASNPTPRIRLIDRALVSAFNANISPILCVTKADLGEAKNVVSHYKDLDFPIVFSGFEEKELYPTGVGRLQELLLDKVSVLLGHSGVGKSTLINSLTGSSRVIGEVNTVTGRGKHTSSSVVALKVVDGVTKVGRGWIIDTPGIRSLGLAHIDVAQILKNFPDLVSGTANCKRGCLHNSANIECGLDIWVEQNGVNLSRLDSYRRLLNSKVGKVE